MEALVAEGLASQAELSRKKAELRLLELDYRDALWQFQGSRLRVVVADSVRTTGVDGLDTISLVLELPPLGVAPGDVPLAEAQLGVADLQVSLVDKGVLVGFPYVRVVPYLSPGQRVEVSFQLLRPVETPTVALEYRGSRQELTLYPRIAATEVPFRLTVAQPSLAVVFGEEGRFQLVFEPLQQQSLTLDLEVRGLPGACLASFRERESGVTVSSLRLGAGSGPREVELSIKLPPGPVGEVVLNEPLLFLLVARYGPPHRQGETTAELRITPVGIPKVELRANSWLVEAAAGEDVAVPLEAVNVGTAPAQQVRVEVEAPAELAARLEPPETPSVAVGEKTRFTLWLKPGRGATAGEYTVRVRPRAANRPVAQGESEGQLRIRVHSSKGWIFAVVLAVVLAGVATLAVRILRKVRLD